MPTFFDLPAELRNYIYELLLNAFSSDMRDWLCFTYARGGLMDKPEFKQYMVLSQVCHQIRFEATSYFYGENNFSFYLTERTRRPFTFEAYP